MLNLNNLSYACYRISKKRNQGNPLKHCAGEVVEAVVAEQNYVAVKDEDNEVAGEIIDEFREDLEYELADIIFCALSCANQYHIDIEDAMERKLKINEKRAQRGE